MLLSYAVSLTGTSHEKRGLPCQDANGAARLPNGWLAVAAADGVGSAAHSEIASRLACDVFTETCRRRVSSDTRLPEAKEIIKEAYREANLRILECARDAGHSAADYDTTLSAVIYTGSRFAYGHSGDGGIVALTKAGDYIRTTSPQKAEDGVCVIPLRAGEAYWEFGVSGPGVAAVLLATDGLYDVFSPYLLRQHAPGLYIPLLRWFMDQSVLGLGKSTQGRVLGSRTAFLCSEQCAGVTDDKTVAVAVNTRVRPAEKDAAYYAEPDWEALQEEWNRKAYPHLYAQPADVPPEGEEE